jgi:ribosomal-protein-alanine N-acetyltransferase
VSRPQRSAGLVGIRLIRQKDAQVLEDLLMENRSWLEQWEATYPGFVRPTVQSFRLKPVIASLLKAHKLNAGVPFVVTYGNRVVGQVNVSSIVGGSVSSAQIGYWVAEDFAGRGIIPTAVALAVDYCLSELRLHRVEICIRPENTASLRVVEKLGFRYEGMRRNYIHIDNRWCDHECFALTVEDVPEGLLKRYSPSG